jgi:Zn-dependent M28 family amino/carboxypeptidase
VRSDPYRFEVAGDELRWLGPGDEEYGAEQGLTTFSLDLDPGVDVTRLDQWLSSLDDSFLLSCAAFAS